MKRKNEEKLEEEKIIKRKNKEKIKKKKIIKDIRNLLRLKKEQNYNAIKGIRTFLDKKKETRAIKDRI